MENKTLLFVYDYFFYKNTKYKEKIHKMAISSIIAKFHELDKIDTNNKFQIFFSNNDNKKIFYTSCEKNIIKKYKNKENKCLNFLVESFFNKDKIKINDKYNIKKEICKTKIPGDENKSQKRMVSCVFWLTPMGNLSGGQTYNDSENYKNVCIIFPLDYKNCHEK